MYHVITKQNNNTKIFLYIHFLPGLTSICIRDAFFTSMFFDSQIYKYHRKLNIKYKLPE